MNYWLLLVDDRNRLSKQSPYFGALTKTHCMTQNVCSFGNLTTICVNFNTRISVMITRIFNRSVLSFGRTHPSMIGISEIDL